MPFSPVSMRSARSLVSALIIALIPLSACQTAAPKSAPPGAFANLRDQILRSAEPARATIDSQLAVRQSPAERAISEAYGKKWIVSTQGRAATDAVKEIFHAGGNLLDAAVAASFAISVERPQSTGLGGGGFLLYREAKTGKIYAIDFRERAPLAATPGMYLDGKGEVIANKSLLGLYAIGVPGLVKGLAEIHRRFGRLPFRRLVDPAVRLAEQGLPVYPALHNASVEEVARLRKFPSTASIFLKPNGQIYELGEKIVQRDLGRTLREIGATNGKSFYTGKLARQIVVETKKLQVKKEEPWLTATDLKNYSVRWMEPVRAPFGEYEIVSMPPPSSGGTHVIEILNLVEKAGLSAMMPLSPESIERKAKAMQFAFIDRARYMGDPAFTKVPTDRLTAKDYAAALAPQIAMNRALSADAAAAAVPVIPTTGPSPGANGSVEHFETTHFSIMDSEGNVVVSTQTINGWFGSGYVVPGTGVMMNNEMDDFSAKPGASNLFGAVGSDANKVEAGKTPLSSMSPTIVLKANEPVLAIGAPGGTRIINCVAQSILNYTEHALPLYESVALTRMHMQWKPDEIVLENESMGGETLRRLRADGYTVRTGKVGCVVMAVSREGARLHGVSDPRDFGQAYGE